jgi:hypothetical protein
VPRQISLPSGLTVDDPVARLLRYCEQEYEYYDGVPDPHPNAIVATDVLVTVALNSWLSDAKRVRTAHRGIRDNCSTLLAAIPRDANLLELEPPFDPVRRLLHCAVQATYVLVPVATKVLHRKRPHLIPMFDWIVLAYYLSELSGVAMSWRHSNKRHAAEAAMPALALFREDLGGAEARLLELSQELEERGYRLSPVRILELLVWTAREPKGYYR